ncbi:MAG: c-type cytochrome, partial [Proteobacteria bacterium]
SVWFQATEEGEVNLFCAEYCGGRSTETTQNGHWAMIQKVNIEPAESFEKFIKEGGGKPDGLSDEEWGAQLAKAKACSGCHSVDGSNGSGPTWKGKWGTMEAMSDGTQIKVDENYVRESILEPQAHLVQGFGPVMPTFKGILNDKEIDALIAYIKSVK